ncbi:hypothetical protein TRFO_19813 [Tritrichomonas foetus]|uniref:Uncharacterized protein n=1 Tax=Tritrichomonas foetus TaxID=1144522 RepID=A0A1J4KN62_9EUKA|nr:hypothetical protein TRFO_19813 [Tritrichomonas foetus]|eukprot:OHT10829.1 hypothetical protein TRFO_19813 [Tritrichomonas foetus]
MKISITVEFVPGSLQSGATSVSRISLNPGRPVGSSHQHFSMSAFKLGFGIDAKLGRHFLFTIFILCKPSCPVFPPEIVCPVIIS